MSDVNTHQADESIRASDAERDDVVTQLQRHFADGRLNQDELEERVGAALAARTRDQLRALTRDLPSAEVRPAAALLPGADVLPGAGAQPGTDVLPARPARVLDPLLLIVLLVICPPAGIAYWLLCRRGVGGGWLAQRQFAGIPNWVWIVIIAVAASAAVH